eukprot:TRINITY_DN67928_c5_g3_i4.p1 TRINITY_DN67928_c5_g3~~TRINITY_DN67928_c5_g3_i4.p1  ORF type:complete len:1320 (+),score=806.53 TRINITY_DN67928_c5_g3_i4:31-3960(+)
MTSVFRSSLVSLVKGLRAFSDPLKQQEYVSRQMAVIKEELNVGDGHAKADAIKKLVYLDMMGYDMSWASFKIVEVMSLPWYGHRRAAYLGASQCFTKDTDVILLTTHLFRKAFTQQMANTGSFVEGAQYETGAAISCLASICTRDLAEDLLHDIYGMLNSSKPYIRKKAVLVLLKVFKMWPKALRLSFDRLKEKLVDDDPGVVSAAVYVVCELARTNPSNYLSLAPQFFHILTTSKNNWVLIKVVKLMGCLIPLEPRLAKKLATPLSDIIETTPAKSLLYECVNTLLSGQVTSKAVIRLCLDNLRSFIEDADQNLKYLGLLGLHKLMQQHPRAVAEHRDLIIDCLTDEDVTIRMRALDLITSMVSTRYLQGIVARLIQHLEVCEGNYRRHVMKRILDICSQDSYAFISDFAWYVCTLVDLTHVNGVGAENADRIREQLMDIALRVHEVRPFLVGCMSSLLLSGRLQNNPQNDMARVLYAAGSIVGEFSQFVPGTGQEHVELLSSMLSNQVSALDTDAQHVFIHNFIKVFSSGTRQSFYRLGSESDIVDLNDPERVQALRAIAGAQQQQQQPRGMTPVAADGDDAAADGTVAPLTWHQWTSLFEEMASVVEKRLPQFVHSHSVEVQERAVAYWSFFGWLFADVRKNIAIVEACNADSGRAATDVPSLTRLDGGKDAVLVAADDSVNDDNNSDNGSKFDDVRAMDDARRAKLRDAAYESIEQAVLQLSALFGDELKPVHPEAQNNVKIPRGLDLDKWINEPPASDSESDDDLFGTGGSSAGGDGGGDSFDDSFGFRSALSPEAIENAQRKREADRMRRQHDVFYIGTHSNSSSKTGTPRSHASASSASRRQGGDGVDLDKIPIRTMQPGDLPPVTVSSASRRASSTMGGVTRYTVKAVEEMPSSMSKSKKHHKKHKKHKKRGGGGDGGDDSDDALGQVDLTKPLDADEVIRAPTAYGDQHRGRDAADTKSSSKKAKKHKKNKKDKKDKKKQKKKGDGHDDVLGMFDPVAAAAEDDDDSEQKEQQHASLASKVELVRRQLLWHNDAGARVYCLVSATHADEGKSHKKHKKNKKNKKHKKSKQQSADGGRGVSIRLIAEAGEQQALDSVTLEFRRSDNESLAGVVDLPASEQDASSTLIAMSGVAGGQRGESGDAMSLVVSADAVTNTHTVTAKLTVVGNGDRKVKKRVKFQVAPSTFLAPQALSIEELQTGPLASGSSKTTSGQQLVTLRDGLTVQTALKDLSRVLNAHLVDARSFKALYHAADRVTGTYACALVSANKDDLSHIQVEIKSNATDQSFVDALLAEVQRAFAD